MNLKIGKTYLTRRGQPIKIIQEIGIRDILIGDFEHPLIRKHGKTDTERYRPNGKHWTYFFGGAEVNYPALDIIARCSLPVRMYGILLRSWFRYKHFAKYLSQYKYMDN